MKRFLFAGLILALITNGAVQAQDFHNTASSGSTSGATANASPHQAQSATSSVNYSPVTNESIPANTTSKDVVDYRGIPQNTPDLMLGGYAGNASQDSCSNTTQFGLSVPGGAAAFGKGKNDPFCGFRRAADYRMRFAQFEMEFARVHPGLETQMITTELNDMYIAHVDMCMAEGGGKGDCEVQAHNAVYPDQH